MGDSKKLFFQPVSPIFVSELFPFSPKEFFCDSAQSLMTRFRPLLIPISSAAFEMTEGDFEFLVPVFLP